MKIMQQDLYMVLIKLLFAPEGMPELHHYYLMDEDYFNKVYSYFFSIQDMVMIISGNTIYKINLSQVEPQFIRDKQLINAYKMFYGFTRAGNFDLLQSLNTGNFMIMNSNNNFKRRRNYVPSPINDDDNDDNDDLDILLGFS